MSATADPVLWADVRANHQAATSGQTTANFSGGLGLPDTAGIGHWNYYCNDLGSAGSGMTLLPWGGNPGWPNAYGGKGKTSDGGWSNVSAQGLWAGPPGATELTWHPGGTSSNDPSHNGPTIIRWTAGPSANGTIGIVGSVRLGDCYFYIKQNNTVTLYTCESAGTSPTFGTISVPITANIASGDTIDFVLMSRPGGFGGGASFISAQIYQTATGVVIPSAPTGLTATAYNKRVNLSWSASSGATGYNVKRSTDGSSYATLQTGVTTTDYQDTGLTNGTTYYYMVSASNTAGEGPDSLPASATPHPPLAPTGVTATPDNKQVNLSWTASAGATDYSVKRSLTEGGSYTMIVTGIIGTSYSDPGLTNGTTYYYAVSASSNGDEGPDSPRVSATPRPVAAPAGLTARGINEQVNLSWTAPEGATGYSIKRSLSGGEPYATIATGVTETTYADMGLTNGVTYYYVVSASNSDGEGPNSTQVSATPEPVLADLRADYQAATSGQTTANFSGGLGLPDTSGAGHWNYYWQNLADNSLTLLAFAGNPSYPYAYGGGGYPANGGWSNVSDHGLWGDAPGPGELTWHPGGTKSYDPNGVEGPTVIRWTAGAPEAGTIDITGAVRLGSATFVIKLDGVVLFASTTDGTNFNLTQVTVSDGSKVDFLLYGGPGGNSYINGKILRSATPPVQNYASWASTNHLAGGADYVGPDGISNLMIYALDGLKLDHTNGSPGTLTGKVTQLHQAPGGGRQQRPDLHHRNFPRPGSDRPLGPGQWCRGNHFAALHHHLHLARRPRRQVVCPPQGGAEAAIGIGKEEWVWRESTSVCPVS